MWIPDPIYKKLPLVYTAAGAALIPAFGATTPIVVSSMMFFAAALTTYIWRRQHQEEPEAAAPSTLRDEWAQRRARRIESMKFKS